MLVLDKWACIAASMASLFADFVYKHLEGLGYGTYLLTYAFKNIFSNNDYE
ncbi:hypothetical protein [Clostridium folliculivorans]|uniref:hypothetical protein n=1 Tax=Clostridium folliculivorans TaxID=2886038 RepID=UPI0021C3849C|nr:hypothetical protein [Clostridium folliculivorans]GKU29313.1 hypothetical protein CFB3_14190 [Clostridium folliculivorans]